MKNEIFRQILNTEFSRRCDKNPSYSLRAFAQNLKISAACLSVMMNGKRKITPAMIERLSKKLDISPMESQALMPDTFSPQFEVLTLDAYTAISIWYHDAIIEMVRTKGFKPDVELIAKKLGISATEVALAVERLARLDILEILKGRWIVRKPYTQILADDFTTSAMKRLQKKVLELSQTALENQDIKNRFHSSLTLAIRKKDLAKAKEMMRKFRDRFCVDMQSNNELDEVYQLAISFYSLENIKGAFSEKE